MKKIIIISLLSIICVQNAFARGTPLSINDKAIENVGTILQFAIPLSAFVYSTYIGDYEGDKQLGKTMGSTFLTTEILKSTVKADRPTEPDGTKGRSFPSGHTSFAFAGAGYWQHRYGWYIGAPMYAAASFVGYSRVKAKAHNFADVVGGTVVGLAFSYWFTTEYNNETTQLSIAPTDGGAYVSFNTKF